MKAQGVPFGGLPWDAPTTRLGRFLPALRVETQWGWGLGVHCEVVEWLELVCVCANVLCWLS